MASIRESLRAIVEAFGVTPTKKSTSGLIGELAAAVEASSGEGGIVVNVLELPTVSASDNGKVLGVINGRWAVMDASSFIQDSTG